METILQADKGVDFDFLVPPATTKTPLAGD